MVRVALASLTAFLAVMAIFTATHAVSSEPAGDRIEQASVLVETGGVTVWTAPQPGWVRPAPDHAFTPTEVSPGSRQQPLRLRLLDQQKSIAGPRPITVTRMVAEVVNRFGVQGASVYTFEIPRETARFFLLEADIVRDGERLDRLADLAVSAGAAQSFDGQIMVGVDQVILRVPGVQPGDFVALTYATVMEVPEGAIARSAFVEPPAMEGADHVRLSLRAPGDAKIRTLAPFEALSETSRLGAIERVYVDGPFTSRDRLADQPAWRLANGAVSASMMTDWEAISSWAQGHYRPDVTAEVEALAASIAAEHPLEEDRIAAALFWVQREIRYFAEVLGASGYTPQSVSETLRLREGDCKAKTLLLISLLDAMGVEAGAALANTTLGPGLDQFAPSVGAFDHVIVTLERNGKRYWLDPTLFEQAGRLDAIGQADYGKVLIADGSDALHDVEISYDRPLVSASDQAVLIAEGDGFTGRIETTLTFHGPAADSIRVLDALAGREATLASLRELAVGERFAFNQLVSPVTLAYDEANNTVTAVVDAEVSLVQGNAASNGASFFALVFGLAPVDPPSGGSRTAPLALTWPFHARHEATITLDGPGLAGVEPFEVARSNAAFDQSITLKRSGNRLDMTAEVRMTGRELAPAQFRTVAADQIAAMDELTVKLGGDAPMVLSRGDTAVFANASAFGDPFSFDVQRTAGVYYAARPPQRRTPRR
ncbi:MAG: transglutaminase family protein [Oceanicaulis sp.]